MEEGLVSVIMPAYRTAAYIREAVDSVLSQTYPKAEIIVVDDGSPDNVHEILMPYIAAKKIVYVYRQNGGLSAARNTGIEHARGEFIALLDTDDMFLPQKLARQVEHLLSHPECDISYCDILHFYDGEPEKHFFLEQGMYSGEGVFEALLRRNFINPLSVVMRRKVIDGIGGFDEQNMRQYAEDWDFWLRAAYAGFRFEHLAEPLGNYRMRRNSISYDATLEVTRKRTVLGIFERLNARMSDGERARYHMSRIIFRHRLRLWYAELAQFFPPLIWLHQSIQKKRLASA